MWSHIGVIAVQARPRLQLKRRVALLAAVCALAILAFPGTGTAASPRASSEVSLAFLSEKAHLVGSQALVRVKCLGSGTSSCNGTLTLTTSGNKHKVPFSVIGGTSEFLTVPLGSDAAKTKRALAVARTAQASGRYSRSSEVLRLRSAR